MLAQRSISFALGLAVGTLLYVPAMADCPASETLCGTGDYRTGEPAATSTAPTFDKICDFAGLNQERASFDIPAGIFKVAVSEGGSIHLWLRDTFVITGPAPGTAVTFHMRVHVDGYVNWTGYGTNPQVQVTLRPLDARAGETPTDWGFGLAGPYRAELFTNSFDLTLQRTAGEPIGVEIDARSEIHNAGSTSLNGSFSFPDLPQGWAVSSCKGYHLDPPVPAIARSWGHLKAAYR